MQMLALQRFAYNCRQCGEAEPGQRFDLCPARRHHTTASRPPATPSARRWAQKAAISSMRFMKAHSLSNHTSTFTSRSPLTRVWLPSTIAENLQWLKSIEALGWST